MRMVLAARGQYFSERQLRRLCDWSPAKSVSSRDVVAAARALWFIHSREDYGLRLRDLPGALQSGIFPIVGIDLQPYGRRGQHAQVVVSVTKRGVSVQDPLLGSLVTSLPIFEQAWSGTDFSTILIE